MSWDDYYTEEERIERLKEQVTKCKERIAELEEENRKLRDERDHAEFRIRNELEPMIKEKRRAYDAYITDPERCYSDDDDM